MTSEQETYAARGVFLRMHEGSDDHGRKVCLMRMAAIKVSSKALLVYIHKSIKNEEDLAVRYNQMLNDLKYEIEPAKPTTCSEHVALEKYRNEIRELNAIHVEAVKRIKLEVEIKLAELRKAHKKVVKDAKIQYDKDYKQLSTCKSQFAQIESQYSKCCNDLALLRETSMTKTGKEAEKHSQRLASTDSAARQAEVKFGQKKEALDRTIADFENNWRNTLDAFEKIERERIDKTRSLMSQMMTIIRDTQAKEHLITGKMLDAINSISLEDDLENFVRAAVDVPAGSKSQNVMEAFNVTMKFQNLNVSGQQPGGSNSLAAGGASSMSPGGYVNDESQPGGGYDYNNNVVGVGYGANGQQQRQGQSDGPLSPGCGEIDYMDMTVDFPTQCNVIALYEYKPSIKEELGFDAGQTMRIIDKQESGWWVAEYLNPDRKRGLIPSNFVKVIP